MATFRRSAVCVSVISALSPPLAAQDSASGRSSPLDEIIVTASRIAIPARQLGTAVSVIDAEEIELRAYRSVADVLRTQPGISVSNAGGQGKVTTVRIRGEESYRTLVMIDGVEVSDPTTPQVAPNFSNFLTSSDIERVEVLRGPQGFIYGADAGGVVNILTRSGAGGVSGQLEFELGDYGLRHIDGNVHGGSERGDFFVSVTDISTDGFNARESDDLLMDEDGYENTTAHAKLGWNVSDSLRLQLVARDIDAINQFDQCGFPTTHSCVGETEQTTFRVTAELDAGSLSHIFAYADSAIARADYADDALSFATDGDLSRIEYIGSFQASDRSTVVYGVDLEEEVVFSSTGDRLQRDQRGYYAEYQGQIAKEIYFTVGARNDRNDDFGAHTSVRVTAAYLDSFDSGATLKYRIGYGTGFRAPSLSEIAYNSGPFAFPPASGVNLQEESSSGYDVGMEYSNDSGLYLEATYFDQRIQDEIYFDLSGFSGYLQSFGTSSSSGIELAAQVPIGSRWQFLGNVTFNDTENIDGEQRIRRPETFANLGALYTSATEKLRFIANYRISSDAVDEIFGIGQVPLPDYQVLDLSLAYSMSERIELVGRIDNATNESYQEVIGFLTGGSVASAGVRIRF